MIRLLCLVFEIRDSAAAVAAIVADHQIFTIFLPKEPATCSRYEKPAVAGLCGVSDSITIIRLPVQGANDIPLRINHIDRLLLLANAA